MSDVLSEMRLARQRENLLEISRAARAAIAGKPELGSGWAEVASLCLEAGDEWAALKAAERLASASPQFAESWLWVASILSAMGEFELAFRTLDAQLAKHPGHALLQRRTGQALLALGRPSTAELTFRRALDLNRDDVLAWEGLAEAHAFEPGDDVVLGLEELRVSPPPKATAQDRGVIAYAVARAYEALGEHDLAARRVGEGAAFYREGAPFDVSRHEHAVREMLDTYDARFAESKAEAGVLDARPVFVIAPPACGASWLSEVLAADASARWLLRRNCLFWMSAAELGDQRPEDIAKAFADAEEGNVLARSGRIYLGMLDERFGRSTKRVIDATGLSEMSAGAAALCLPAAKFIRITRDPRDLAWAIYKRRFDRGRFWTYHPDDIARILVTHNQLCQRWDELFGDRIITVSYEALSADPEAEVRRVAKAVGVDVDAALAEAWLRLDTLKADPPGVHEQAGARFEAIEAALKRAGLVV